MDEFEDIIRMLDELPKGDVIENKLDEIIDLLEELIANNQENNEIELSVNRTLVDSINEVDINLEEIESCAFLGFNINEIENCFTQNQLKSNRRFCSTNAIESKADLIAIATNTDDEDVLAIEFYKGCKRKVVQELIEIIRNRTINIIIGRGPSAQSIALDLPNIHFVLFANSVSNIPNELLATVDKVYQKTE